MSKTIKILFMESYFMVFEDHCNSVHDYNGQEAEARKTKSDINNDIHFGKNKLFEILSLANNK